MSTGTVLIKLALREIGADSVAQPDDPEAIEIGMGVLNSMLQLWLSQQIDIGIVPLEKPGDELGEPLDTRQVIIDNLAIAMSPNYDNGAVVVSQELKDNARRGYTRMRGLYQVFTIPNKIVSSTLPRGQGNNRGGLSSPFAGKGAEIPSSDA